ncbi:unnamed protein product [Discosporangium mesarthrocarpum]
MGVWGRKTLCSDGYTIIMTISSQHLCLVNEARSSRISFSGTAQHSWQHTPILWLVPPSPPLPRFASFCPSLIACSSSGPDPPNVRFFNDLSCCGCCGCCRCCCRCCLLMIRFCLAVPVFRG